MTETKATCMVQVKRPGGLAVGVRQVPLHRNALSRETVSKLAEAVSAFPESGKVPALVATGPPPAVRVGAALGQLDSGDSDWRDGIGGDREHALCPRLAKPATVNGAAAVVGTYPVLVCEVRLAAMIAFDSPLPIRPQLASQAPLITRRSWQCPSRTSPPRTRRRSRSGRRMVASQTMSFSQRLTKLLVITSVAGAYELVTRMRGTLFLARQSSCYAALRYKAGQLWLTGRSACFYRLDMLRSRIDPAGR